MYDVCAPRTRSWGVALLPLTLAVLSSGCGNGVGQTYPVAGKIALNDQPWTAKTTVILCKPNAARGNASTLEPTGTVDDQGNYTLTTRGVKGAPPGWYVVLVTATSPTAETSGDPKHKGSHPHPGSLLPAKYGQVKTSGLEIEVVEAPAPGAYDLQLTR